MEKCGGFLFETINEIADSCLVDEKTVDRMVAELARAEEVFIGKVAQASSWLKNIYFNPSTVKTRDEAKRAALMVSRAIERGHNFLTDPMPVFENILYALSRSRDKRAWRPRVSSSGYATEQLDSDQFAYSLQKKKAKDVYLTRYGKFDTMLLPEVIRKVDFLSLEDKMLLAGIHSNALKYAVDECNKASRHDIRYFRSMCSVGIKLTTTFADWKHGKDLLTAYQNQIKQAPQSITEKIRYKYVSTYEYIARPVSEEDKASANAFLRRIGIELIV